VYEVGNIHCDTSLRAVKLSPMRNCAFIFKFCRVTQTDPKLC